MNNSSSKEQKRIQKQIRIFDFLCFILSMLITILSLIEVNF